MEIFSYAFMQRAFIVGNIIAVIAPMLGVFLVLKRLALIGHTIAHVALAGVALGLFLGIYPVFMAIIVSVFAALIIEKLRENYEDYAELSLAIILATGLGLMTILVSMLPNNARILSYLFGSISMVTQQDLYLIIPLGIVISLIIFILYHGFIYITFNEQQARLSGVPVRLLNILFMVLISITVSLSMRIVGGLLIASLITLPVAAGLQLANSFKATIFYSIFFGLISVNSGLMISFYYDLAPGGVIIMVGVVCLLLSIIYKNIRENFMKIIVKRG